MSLNCLIFFLITFLFSTSSATEAISAEEIENRLRRLENYFLEDEKNLEQSKSTLEKVRRMVSAQDTGNMFDTNATKNAVVFQAQLTTSYSTMSPKQIIQFDNITTNIGNAYDENFGRFKAPFAGLYEFVLTATSYSGQMVNLEMVKNGAMLCRAHAASSNYETGVCVSMVHLDVDDDVWVRHYNGQGSYLYSTYYPTFAGHLIKAD